jgi:innexin
MPYTVINYSIQLTNGKQVVCSSKSIRSYLTSRYLFYTAVTYIADYLKRYESYVHLRQYDASLSRQKFQQRFRAFLKRCQGSSLTCFYIAIKCFYMFNAIGQFFFLQYFLSYHDIHYVQYAFRMLLIAMSSQSLPESQLFPHITLCDFHIRELGEQHHYTVECILVINVFIEKLYFVLWIWLCVLFLVTMVDTSQLIYRLFLKHARRIFIVQHLDLLVNTPAATELASFARMPIDIHLTLRILSGNVNQLIIADILDELRRRQ